VPTGKGSTALLLDGAVDGQDLPDKSDVDPTSAGGYFGRDVCMCVCVCVCVYNQPFISNCGCKLFEKNPVSALNMYRLAISPHVYCTA
jgi:hypothetical protein